MFSNFKKVWRGFIREFLVFSRGVVLVVFLVYEDVFLGKRSVVYEDMFLGCVESGSFILNIYRLFYFAVNNYRCFLL